MGPAASTLCKVASIPGRGAERYGDPKPRGGGVNGPGLEGSDEVEKDGDGVLDPA